VVGWGGWGIQGKKGVAGYSYKTVEHDKVPGISSTLANDDVSQT